MNNRSRAEIGSRGGGWSSVEYCLDYPTPRRKPRKLGFLRDPPPRGRVSIAYFAGLYQLSSPSWSFLAAASGVSVPLMTLADSTQVSFSRFGVPRDRI